MALNVAKVKTRLDSRMSSKLRALAPGARVVVRDEEWVVRKVKVAPRGGGAIHVVGVPELVRGKE